MRGREGVRERRDVMDWQRQRLQSYGAVRGTENENESNGKMRSSVKWMDFDEQFGKQHSYLERAWAYECEALALSEIRRKQATKTNE